MDIIKVFADNVKKYRKEKGYSQKKFAEYCRSDLGTCKKY